MLEEQKHQCGWSTVLRDRVKKEVTELYRECRPLGVWILF